MNGYLTVITVSRSMLLLFRAHGGEQKNEKEGTGNEIKKRKRALRERENNFMFRWRNEIPGECAFLIMLPGAVFFFLLRFSVPFFKKGCAVELSSR